MGSLFFMVGLLASVAGTPQTEAPLRFTYTAYHMGVDARLTVYAPDQTAAEAACSATFRRIAEVEDIMSDYRKASELMLLCDRAGGPPVKVSRELFIVLQRAIQVARLSEGAFDVTVGPLVKLWRTARQTRVLPTQAELSAAKRLVGWQHVSLDPVGLRVRLKLKGMRLDFGGIAKGYAADEAQKALRANRVTSALVEMGGDIVVSAPPPGQPGWRIKVPNAGTELVLSNQAVSSSGDTEQFVEIGGKRYSHVVDPRTGWALTNRVQATVLAKDGLTSDPISTALTLLNRDQRARLLEAYPGTKSFVRSLGRRAPKRPSPPR